jgi:hypothetical protein
VTPAALLTHGGHVVDHFVELVGNALFVEEQAQALRIGEGRGRGENLQLAGRHRGLLGGYGMDVSTI